MADDKLREWLRLGGARQMRRGVAGEVYSVHGPDRERETAAGGKTLVAYMLSPKLKLSVRQRATGQCYGAYTEMTEIAGGNEFLKMRVDGGAVGGAGNTESMVQKMRMVQAARIAMDAAPPFTYQLGKHRGEGSRGRHDPIKARFIADSVAVNGWSLEAICLISGWWVERRDKGQHMERIIPDRQRKAAAEALRVVLDVIDSAWQARGWSAPYEFGGIEVE